MALLSRDFVKMVGLALLIAPPLAWYFVHQWMEGFAFRANISYWIFVFTALVAIVIPALGKGSIRSDSLYVHNCFASMIKCLHCIPFSNMGRG